MKTVGAAIEEAQAFLAGRGVAETRANAEFLAASVLGIGRGELAARLDRPLDERRLAKLRSLSRARGRRIPLAYVLGTQPFLGMDLKVTRDVLIPRPETEELVEAVLGALRARGLGESRLSILDIGTGSGCIALALARGLPNALVIAVDLSKAALTVAEENARRVGVSARVRILREDLFHPNRTAVFADVVVSNPPYVPSARIGRLEDEVRREPILALDGGKTGLDAIGVIVKESPKRLKPGGLLALEIDDGQGAKVRRLAADAGFPAAEIRRDSNGLERIVLAWLPG